jgi:threonine dehydrogenase-like Zn-dependent dehydrogenase
VTARALWITGPGSVELRDEPEPTPGAGDVVVETQFSGISRGTERTVLRGGVPESERERMRCPGQVGDFPWPVKYGYAAVGLVRAGADDLVGRTVFVLHPHQDRFGVSRDMCVPVPSGVPPQRAVLAANMETAINVIWDGGVGPGDRVAVIGAGVVGALAGRLAARIPGTDVTLVDLNPARAALARALGCTFAAPEQAPGACDVVIHASASAAGLETALAVAGHEATVVEASWYGDRAVEVGLGGGFHSQRLRLISSQVGRLPPSRAPRWNHARRLRLALDLLADPALDVLISGETVFEDLAEQYAAILDDPATLCHRVRYR